MAHLRVDELRDFGVEAAQAYLDESEPLDQKIASIAGREDLGPEEVRRVAEFANQATYESLWKVAERKTIEFERADPDQILTKLNAEALVPPRSIRFHKAARLSGSEKRASSGGPSEAELLEIAEKRVATFKEAGTPEQRLEHLFQIGQIKQAKIRQGVHDAELEKRAAEERAAESIREMLHEAYYDAGGPGTKRGLRALMKAASEVVAAVDAYRPHHLKRAARLTLVAAKVVEPRLDLDAAKFAALMKNADGEQAVMGEAPPPPHEAPPSGGRRLHTSTDNDHDHTVDVDENGNGTTSPGGDDAHTHDVRAYQVLEARGHTHRLLDKQASVNVKTAAPIEAHRIAGFLSTPDMPVAVVNGEHRVWMDLDVVEKCDEDLAKHRFNLVQADDEVAFMAKKIRENAGIMAGSRY